MILSGREIKVKPGKKIERNYAFRQRLDQVHRPDRRDSEYRPDVREALFVSPGDLTREPVFSPRMVHSGWGIDRFPNAHLNAIAHAGMDAILVFVKGVNRTTVGHLDINDLIARIWSGRSCR